jgi:hypothetical protein
MIFNLLCSTLGTVKLKLTDPNDHFQLIHFRYRYKQVVNYRYVIIKTERQALLNSYVIRLTQIYSILKPRTDKVNCNAVLVSIIIGFVGPVHVHIDILRLL